MSEEATATPTPPEATTGTSESTKVGINFADPLPEETVAFRELVPEQYRDKPYIQNIKSTDDFFEQFDNSQSLIGKKTTGVPDANAPQEEWQSFYESLRPQTAEEYQFNDITLPEEHKELESIYKTDSVKAQEERFRQIAYDVGLTRQQAEVLREKWIQGEIAESAPQLKEYQDKMDQVQQDFEQVGKKIHGADYDKVVDKGLELMKQHSHPDFQGRLDELTGEVKAWASDMLLRQQKALTGEDTLTTTSVTTEGGIESMRDELYSILQNPNYRNDFHKDSGRLRARAAELSGRIATLESKG